MTVYALTNLKGGSAKTTSAMLLATALTRLGKTVTVIDLDPQGSATQWAQRAEDSDTPLPFPVQVGNAHSLKRLPKTDYTLLDCPPGSAGIIEAAMTTADHIIIPVQPSPVEVEQMWATLDLAHNKPATVLLASVMLGTKTLTELQQALEDENVAVFRDVITRREAIKNYYGTLPGTDLYGYAHIARQIIEENN